MLLNLTPQVLNFLFIVIETVAQVLLHVLNFGLLGEKIKQVFYFEHIVLSDNSQCFLNFNLLTLRIGNLRFEQMLGNLHPKLFASLTTDWLIGVITSHVCIVDVNGFADGL